MSYGAITMVVTVNRDVSNKRSVKNATFGQYLAMSRKGTYSYMYCRTSKSYVIYNSFADDLEWPGFKVISATVNLSTANVY